MLRTAADDAIDAYLDRLDTLLADLPQSRRDACVHATIDRVVDARAELPDRDDPRAVRAMLDEIGTPEAIAAAQYGPGERRPPHDDNREKLAIMLLLIGGFFAGLGWLAGLALLWLSPRWRDRDKLIGTFLLPGGLVAASVAGFFLFGFVFLDHADGTFCVYAGDHESCGDPSSETVAAVWALAVAVLAILPVGTAVHLWRCLGEARRG